MGINKTKTPAPGKPSQQRASVSSGAYHHTIFIQPTLPKGQAGRPEDEFEIGGGDEKPEWCEIAQVRCPLPWLSASSPGTRPSTARGTSDNEAAAYRGGDVMAARVVPDGLSHLGVISGASAVS